ncbi:MAG: hypothetical protein ACOCZ9_01175 [Spirochaetota bacterium]
MEYQLFVDLDGVLCDFDRAVSALFGRPPKDLQPREMWSRLAHTPGFYTNLPWMPDGHELWNFVRPLQPTILTGLPRGTWAEPQKREWCRRELGENVPVITCMAREKTEKAKAAVHPGQRMILIDDRESNGERWEAEGGIFILHESASKSIQALRALGLGE